MRCFFLCTKKHILYLHYNFYMSKKREIFFEKKKIFEKKVVTNFGPKKGGLDLPDSFGFCVFFGFIFFLKKNYFHI